MCQFPIIRNESESAHRIISAACLGLHHGGHGALLTIDDFRRVFTFPKAVLIGTTAQLIVLPLVGYGIVSLFGLSGGLAVGLMILAACPGGPTSNLISHLSRGDLALSITLTAISSVVTVFTIPFIVNASILHFGEQGTVTLPILQSIIQIMGVTVVPAALGMWIRHKSPSMASRADRPVRLASGVFFVLILLAAILKEFENIGWFFVLSGPAALILNVVMMGGGYLAARQFGLDVRQRLTISIETGIQNGTLGILIAATLLENSTMTIPIAIYSLLMFGTAALMIPLGNRLTAPTH